MNYENSESSYMERRKADRKEKMEEVGIIAAILTLAIISIIITQYL